MPGNAVRPRFFPHHAAILAQRFGEADVKVRGIGLDVCLGGQVDHAAIDGEDIAALALVLGLCGARVVHLPAVVLAGLVMVAPNLPRTFIGGGEDGIARGIVAHAARYGV